jgi:hypothetical protein
LEITLDLFQCTAILQKHGTSEATSESHSRNGGKTDRFSSLRDESQPSINENQPRNAGQDGRQDRRHSRIKIDGKTDATLREMKAEIRANNENVEVLRGTIVSLMDLHYAKTEANHEELMAVMKDSHKRIEAPMDVSQEETEAYPEMMGSTLEEVTPEEVHEEVLKEEAAVKIVTALKKPHEDRHRVVGCRKNSGIGESRNKLAANCRGMTCRAISARRKRHVCQGQGKDKAVTRAPKGRA